MALKSVIITQSELTGYTGSEIITLELAEYFSRDDYKVIVYTNTYNNPIKRDFEKLKNVYVATSLNDISLERINLIWVHHQLIPEKLLKHILSNKNKARVVFHHMSGYHPLEYPVHYELEQNIADCILFNSQETKNALTKTLRKSRCSMVFGNPAPDAFNRPKPPKLSSDTPKKCLVVTNHIPKDLEIAINLLNNKGVKVSTIGAVGNMGPKRVTPDIIESYDVIISIGKTVQYSIVRGVPVYCYDHFGGPGYLNNKNFAKAQELNFSGRGFSKKTPEDICKEILSGYKKALEFASRSHNLKANLLLSTKMKDVLTHTSYHKKYVEPDVLESYITGSTLFWDIYRQSRSLNDQLIEEFGKTKELRNQLSESQRMINISYNKYSDVENEIFNMRKSLSWRITTPLRAINKQLKK